MGPTKATKPAPKATKAIGKSASQVKDATKKPLEDTQQGNSSSESVGGSIESAPSQQPTSEIATSEPTPSEAHETTPVTEEKPNGGESHEKPQEKTEGQ